MSFPDYIPIGDPPQTSGKLPRQDDWNTLLRGLENRSAALEYDRPKAYIQNDSVVSWVIDHGKARNVAVAMFDFSGNEIYVTVQCPTENTVLISSETAFSGTAIVF